MIRGRLKFENPGPVPQGQQITIRAEDTGRAGASAVEIARATVEIPEDFNPETDMLPFEIDCDATRQGLTLRAHMPCHAGEDIRTGDMISTTALPVSEAPAIALTLRRI